MLTALDQIANQNHLQMFKATVPYLPREQQRFISLYIKFLELKNVTSFFSARSGQLQSCSPDRELPRFSDMINDIRNYCDENDKQMLDQISSLITAMELYAAMSGDEESEEDYE